MTTTALTPIDKMKSTLALPTVQEQFQNAMAENSNLFVASLIEVYGSNAYLQKCEPKLVIMEALKAATLKLPINANLGFAYIVPYKKAGKQIPQFQIGYKGYLQLAQRTGQYRCINADVVLEGELKGHNKVSGEIDISGDPTSGEVVGYFAHIETVTGFRKTVYWSRERVTAHAKRYSASFSRGTSAWSTNFDEMALKTMIRHILSKYGIMSVEMVGAFTQDAQDERTPEARLEDDVNNHANQGNVLDIAAEAIPDPELKSDPLDLKADRLKELKAVVNDMTTVEQVDGYFKEHRESLESELGRDGFDDLAKHAQGHINFIKKTEAQEQEQAAGVASNPGCNF